MKKIFLVTICAMLFNGCISSVDEVQNTSASETISVWECGGRNVWKLYLSEDGTISEVIRPDGMHMVIAEGGVLEELESDQYVNYVYGPCTWSYDSDSKILKMIVTIEDFSVSTDKGGLSCSIVDVFEGPVSSDGESWTAEWRTTTKSDLSIPDDVISGRTLLFRKIK